MKTWQDVTEKPADKLKKQYFFILGREAHLAVVELISILAKRRLSYNIVGGSREALVVEAEELPKELFAELGGMIKYGECLFEAPTIENLKTEKLLAGITGDKMIFGFSVYALSDLPAGILKNIKSKLDRLAMVLKKEIRPTIPRVRYVVSRDLALSSVVVLTNKLMRAGGHEFVVLVQGEKIIVGRTLATQDFKEFRHRDFGRPARDPKRGTLPPKLARLLINLAGVPENGTLLDPFCGDGTVLTEAIALGYANLIGTDIDPAAVKNTKANTDWCLKEYQYNADIRLFAAPARDMGNTLPPQSIDAIVTEGDLGAPLRERLNYNEAVKAVEAKSILYRETLTALAPLLKRGGRMVLVLPHYPTSAGEFGVSFAGLSFESLHLAPVDLWPQEVSKEIGRFGQFGSYIYGREDQKVEREIFIFEKI